MHAKVALGYDSFRTLRENNLYYIDKTLFIKDFLDNGDKVILITRPRRFGKTLNMTMVRDFFDITQDSLAIFEGLAIRNTDYAKEINTRPVISLSLKDCDGTDPADLACKLCDALEGEFERYYLLAREQPQKISRFARLEKLRAKIQDQEATLSELSGSMKLLLEVAHQIFGIHPLLLLDEYDTPVMSAHENGYHQQVQSFFSTFYGSALKGQEHLGRALLTGIQRVAKESIFSKLNNVRVYTLLDSMFAPYFGFHTAETEALLFDHGLQLTEEVQRTYDGYLIGGEHMYNPWSILCYCKDRVLKSYWINTSSNRLIRQCLESRIPGFREDLNELFEHGFATVHINLETAFSELQNASTLWGLFLNSGYLTVRKQLAPRLVEVTIPNREVKEEFQDMVAETMDTNSGYFSSMTHALTCGKYEEFSKNYKALVRDCVSSFDLQKNSGRYENPYHMLTLGMVLSLDYLYDIKSNYETGDGRADIRMVSKQPHKRAHIVMEFKRTTDLTAGAKQAFSQIRDNRYAEDLLEKGEPVLALGIAHDSKKCEIKMEFL